SRAARIGPMVCELDGPIPTLKISKTLKVMGPVCTPAGRCSCMCTTQTAFNHDRAGVAALVERACPGARQGAARALRRPAYVARIPLGGFRSPGFRHNTAQPRSPGRDAPGYR